MSIVHCWKCFFARYFHNWCKNNAVYGLLVDSSTVAVGLIRKKSVSLLRSLEEIELIVEGNIMITFLSLLSLDEFYIVKIYLAFS